MQFSKRFVATLLVLGAAVTTTRAFEGEEEACPSFANATENPSCEECVSSSCGYAIDHGDCVKDCATVTDTVCFSLGTSNTTVVSDICTEAMAAGGGGGGATEEEEMCAAFETSRAAATCETCVEAGCGWTADDGDCLKNCGEVNDGATCLEMSGEAGQTSEAVCASATSSGGGSGGGSGTTAGTSGAVVSFSEGAAAAVTLSAAVASLLI